MGPGVSTSPSAARTAASHRQPMSSSSRSRPGTSIRARPPSTIVEKFLIEESPEDLCLQETKVRDTEFPGGSGFRQARLRCAPMVCGQRSITGVAIVEPGAAPRGGPARLAGQRRGAPRRGRAARPRPGPDARERLHPRGRRHPRPRANPKFGQKLDFLERMTRWADKRSTGRRCSSATSTSPRSNATSTTTRRCSRSSATRRSKCETLGRSATRTAGSTSAGSTFPRPSATRRGGPTARYWRQKDQGPAARPHVGLARPRAPRRGRTASSRRRAGWEQPSDHVPLVTEFDL